jgi:hypothetical protein
MKVISFCIYGSADKYCRGLQENLDIIQRDLPDYNVFIYVGDNVDEKWINIFNIYPFVKLFYTNRIGHDNMINRFFAIDEPNVEIAFIRDSDSRIHQRDLWCIRDFEKSSTEFVFTTTRDHKEHRAFVMGGLWGIKKGALPYKLTEYYSAYNNGNQKINQVQHDQQFLARVIYPLVYHKSVVYTFHEHMRMTDKETIRIIEVPITNDDFCGQVILYNENGDSYREYKWP